MRAEIEVDCENPEIVIEALRPDTGASEKFSAGLAAGKGKLLLSVEAGEIGGLVAGVNSYMRLIRAAIATEGVK
jgi:tRNA threonylcarbamoyladenosine modification (KEOPS) complex  Pcc1 subunit